MIMHLFSDIGTTSLTSQLARSVRRGGSGLALRLVDELGVGNLLVVDSGGGPASVVVEVDLVTVCGRACGSESAARRA